MRRVRSGLHRELIVLTTVSCPAVDAVVVRFADGYSDTVPTLFEVWRVRARPVAAPLRGWRGRVAHRIEVDAPPPLVFPLLGREATRRMLRDGGGHSPGQRTYGVEVGASIERGNNMQPSRSSRRMPSANRCMTTARSRTCGSIVLATSS